MLPEEMEIINKIGKEAKMKEKQYIRGNTQEPRSRCPNCGNVFFKNNGLQIVYFCSKKCRKDYREFPNKIEVVK